MAARLPVPLPQSTQRAQVKREAATYMGKRQTVNEIAELLLAGMPPAVVINTLQAPRQLVYDVQRKLGSYQQHPSTKVERRNRRLENKRTGR